MMEVQRGYIGIVAAFPAATTKPFNQLKFSLQRTQGLGVAGVCLSLYPLVLVFLLARIAAILLLLTSQRMLTDNAQLHKFKERQLMSQLL